MSVDTTVRSAHEAFLTARQVSLQTRAKWVEGVGDALEARREDLVTVAQGDTNLPEARLNTELTRTVFQLKLLAEETRQGEFLDATIDHADENWGMGPRPDIRRINVPLGVVGVFGASNFPFAFSVAGGDTASALAAGCSVVHKIHGGHKELGALTAEVVASALREAGAPEGLFGAITGRQAGIELVEHPLVKAVGFTGSVSGGRALFDRAVSRPEPIPFYGELGSINPVVVTEGAWKNRPEEIIEGFIGSMTMGIGQFCTKPGLLFLPTDAAEAAQQLLTEKLAGVDLPGKMLNERICEGFIEAREHVSQLPGVQTISEGSTGNPPSPSVYFARAEALTEQSEVLHTEMFGPAAVVISYTNQRQLTDVVGRLQGQLTGTVHCEDDEDITAISQSLQQRCGRLIRNGWPTGVTVSYAQNHGGPYPATTASNTTSVGTAAIRRFLRPVAYQGFTEDELPEALKEDNPLKLRRRVDGEWTR
ncbi:aldehyde dehydrogenase (NADP(+)) [Nesterenkonia alba]|uniref:aldehyde dehydrogenase (NADP(+)) n=1 Tax=Nesterenkonia alba TaxID=515814 RepID=UPI0003B38B07|nr:aldehyde dehydrogenase (NADP(+)) [Nesterenkonia alba]